MKSTLITLCLLLLVNGAFAQTPIPAPAPAAAPTPPPPATETVAPNIPGVVAGGTRVQVVKDGFQGTEGPHGLPDGSLLFTETAANRITKIAPDGTTSTFLENTNGSNGLAFDAKGRLYTVQTVAGSTKVGIIYPKGSEAVLADNIDGKPFNRPNDLTIDRKGGVYFTDFPFQAPAAGSQAPAPAVYYIPAGGNVIKVADGIDRPNGIQLSKDEKTLYLNNNSEWMIAFDVQPDGTLANQRNFAHYMGLKPGANGVIASSADGLTVDNDGRLYAATNVGVQVFDAKGTHLGTIQLSRAPQNLAFAGADKKTLYVVGRGAAFKVQMLAQGIKDRK